MSAAVIPFRRAGGPMPIHAPLTVDALTLQIGPGRTVHAYSASSGKRLGIVAMTLYGHPEKFGGADVAYVRGPDVNTLLPIGGLRFRVEHDVAEGAA